MKINLNPNRHRQGSIWLVILFLFFIVFILGVAYIIIRTIQDLFDRPPAREDEQALYQRWYDVEIAGCYTNEVITWNSSCSEYEYPAVTATVTEAPLSIGKTNNQITVANTFGGTVMVQRSTNLIYWETIATITGNGEYTDTNVPPHMAFYRRMFVTNNTAVTP